MMFRVFVFVTLLAGITANYHDCQSPENRCPRNEEYSYCVQSVYRAQYCSQIGQSIRIRNDQSPCKTGCVCKPNFLRNYNGTCIPVGQCNTTNCGPNETLDNCPIDCSSQYCPSSEQNGNDCIRPDEYHCPPPVCKCRLNYRRTESGICIPTRSCPPFECCRPNEEYEPCPPFCPSDDCSLARIEGRCPFNIGILLICNPKCQCKPGYGRSNGVCVPFRNCPDICPTNEVYNPCTQAVGRPQNCSNRNSYIPCHSVSQESCKKGCVCEENYYRNDTGSCVPEYQCPG